MKRVERLSAPPLPRGSAQAGRCPSPAGRAELGSRPGPGPDPGPGPPRPRDARDEATSPGAGGSWNPAQGGG